MTSLCSSDSHCIDLVECPDAQFRVLVDVGVVDVFPSVGWRDKVEGVELPACGLDEAQCLV